VESVLEKDKQRALDAGVPKEAIASNIAEVICDPDVGIVVEAIGGIGAAREYVLAALNAGKTVVTSNKELFCKYSHELERAAKRQNAGLYFEASCVGGVPVIRALLDNLQGNKILSMTGIVNGTTNYILSKMSREGASYEEVLKEAQKLGYAEANPEADVEGYDATYKLSILSSLAFHTKIPYTKIYREGITGISVEDINYGKQLGYAIKLLAIGKNGANGIEVRVHPAFIPQEHPLASVNDSYNAVYITGDSVEDVMLYGRGAGALPTGSAIVGDVIYCATHSNYRYSTFENTKDAAPGTKFIENFESAYYIRVNASNRTGVLAKITSIFSRCGINVAKMVQEDGSDSAAVPVIFVTHKTKEQSVNKAVEELKAIPEIAKVAAVIRVVS